MDNILLQVMVYPDLAADKFADTRDCAIAHRIRESDPDIDHVYVSENRITIRRISTNLLYHFRMPLNGATFREGFDILQPKQVAGEPILAKEIPPPFMLILRESDLEKTEYSCRGRSEPNIVIEHDGRKSGPRTHRSIPT